MAANIITFGYLGVELVHDALCGLVNFAFNGIEELIEFIYLVFDNLGVVHYDVQWISHFMGDC